jgi:hypothetical protein
MLDPFDTQMLDYQSDIDVQMQGSDPWFHAEATMEEDAHPTHLQKSPFLDHSVEVEMQADEGESTEYEMTDEVVEEYHGSGELVDVEVYDASQAHTPLPSANRLPAHDGAGPVILSSSPSSHEILAEALSHDGSHEEVSHPESGYELHSTQPETAMNLSEIPDSHPPQSTVYESHDASDTQSAVPLTENDASLPLETTALESEEIKSSDPHREIQDQDQTVKQPLEEHRSSPEPEDHLGSLDVHQGEGHPAEQDSANSVSDPLEISEGVYIDPPPAVLLCLLSSEELEICLFNQPHSQSGSTTPISGPSTQQTLMTVLLQDQPTLYYEPLASVFEALRKDESIAGIPNLIEGELVLNAYDLQLVISEDNVYAREVTLHDLNVLHDGSDLPGPLRLQLQSSVPRFILRYHSLRDQITRLNLSEENEKELHQQEETRHEESEPDQEEQAPAVTSPSQGQPGIHEEDTDLQHLDATGSHDQVDEICENPNHEAEGNYPHQEQEENLVGEDNEVDTTVGPEEHINHAPDASGVELHHSSNDNRSTTANVEYANQEVPNEDQDSYDNAEQSDETSEEREQEDASSVEVRGSLADILNGPERQDPQAIGSSNDYSAANTSSCGTGSTIDAGQIDELYTTTDDSHEIVEVLAEAPESVLDESDANSAGKSIVIFGTSPDHLLGPPAFEKLIHSEVIVSGDPEELNEEEWDDSLDGEGEPDPSWDGEYEDESIQSSVTLSSKASSNKASSKRAFDEVEQDNEPEIKRVSPPSSPGPKRPRVQ